jgi:hypothetical protein
LVGQSAVGVGRREATHIRIPQGLEEKRLIIVFPLVIEDTFKVCRAFNHSFSFINNWVCIPVLAGYLYTWTSRQQTSTKVGVEGELTEPYHVYKQSNNIDGIATNRL